MDVRSLGAFGTHAGLILDLLAFLQGPKTLHVNVGVMHEKIIATVVRLNETIAFFLIEPLHCACTHCFILLSAHLGNFS